MYVTYCDNYESLDHHICVEFLQGALLTCDLFKFHWNVY
jgi:hypothetical protein